MFGAVLIHCGIIAFIVLIVICLAFGDDKAAYYKHFVNFGAKEGRQGSSLFNLSAYKNRYSDLQKAFGGNNKSYYEHYCSFGYYENRKAN
ncbi:MAG: hypothetical protein IJL89_09470 [Firmicutes bacterium]|nr:hypothetical protein [Bacillota bacterium]